MILYRTQAVPLHESLPYIIIHLFFRRFPPRINRTRWRERTYRARVWRLARFTTETQSLYSTPGPSATVFGPSCLRSALLLLLLPLRSVRRDFARVQDRVRHHYGRWAISNIMFSPEITRRRKYMVRRFEFDISGRRKKKKKIFMRSVRAVFIENTMNLAIHAFS